MTPAPDTGRTAEELKSEIIAALNAAFRGFSFPGGRWSTGYGAEMAADALLAGPLADLINKNASLRDQLRESTMEHIARDISDEQAADEISHLRAENANLRDRVREAEGAAEAMRGVQEAVVARWREAAMMAVGGDIRRLQRLLTASQDRIVGSATRADDEPRCTATGNLCGTDTVIVGRQCPDNRWGGRCAHRIAEAAKLALLTQEEGR